MEQNFKKISDSVLFLAKIPLANSRAAFINTTDEDKAYKELAKVPDLDPQTEVNLVGYGFKDELPENSVAYHPILGSVMYDGYYWSFSTRRFIEDLKAAEANPNIIGHLIHVDSNGGEAYGCHEAFEVVKNLKKPCIAIVDSMAASAGYYLCCAADKVYARSLFSEIGCIGTMCLMYNDKEMFKKWGIKELEYYSNYSPLKNKTIKDALEGKGDEYVKRFLDPLALQFISDVRSVRASVGEDSDAAKGEIFYTSEAQPAGLCDGICKLEDAVSEILSKHKPATTKEPSIDINTLNF